MADSGDLDAHIAAATTTARAAQGMTHTARRHDTAVVGLTFAVCALARSLDRFAAAIESPSRERDQP